jgi:hypothetical protein
LLPVVMVVACYVILQVILTVRMGLRVTPGNPRGLNRKALAWCLLLPPVLLFAKLQLFALFLYQGYCTSAGSAYSHACGRGEYTLSSLGWVLPMVSVPVLMGWLLCGLAIGYAAWVRKR